MKHRRGHAILYVAGTIAVIVVFAVFVGLRVHRHGAEAKQRHARTMAQALGPAVNVVRATPAPPLRKLVVPAEVLPYQQVDLYAKVAGYLGDLRVDRGDRVKRGELLGVVTTPETDQQLAPLRANLVTRQVIADRLRALVPLVATQQDLDRADADVQAGQSEVDRLAMVKGFERITAPFDGIITTRYVNVGAMLPAATGSTQASQPLVEVADTSRVRIVAYLGQRDATQVRVGDAVTISRDSDPQHPTLATVSRIPRALDPRTRTMPVEIDIDNADARFYPGVFVLVTLSVPAPSGVIIPSDAIVLVDGKSSVVIADGAKARFSPVVAVDDDGKTARILSGVQAGELVVAQVNYEVTDGGPSQPRLPKAPGAGSGSGSASPARGAS